MAKYRIVKMKHYQSLYSVQIKKWFIWWEVCRNLSIKEAEESVNIMILETKIERDNPRDIIIKTY